MSDMDVTARFRADISDMQSKMSKVESSLKGVQGSADKSSKGFNLLRGTMATAFGGAAIGAVYKGAQAIKNFATGSVAAAVEARKADDRITAIAKSMGLLDTTLGGSTQRLSDFATNLQATSGVSDETIKQGQALILTFSNIAKTAGEQGGMFDRATAAAVDLSAAGFGSVEGASKSLGKALQDPVKGITALGRQGVSFTAAEKEKIKALVESGQILKAQTIIMKAVENQVGGTAAATMTAGDKMRVAFDEFQETVGKAVLPGLEKVQLFIAEKVVPALETFVNYIRTNVFPIAVQVFGTMKDAVVGVYQQFMVAYAALQPFVPLILTLTASILGTVAAYKLLNAAQTSIAAIKAGITTLIAKQRALNAAVLANPYVLLAAVIVGSLILIGGAFKYVYDRSEPLRKAVSDLTDTIKTAASVVMNDLIGAFTGGGDAAGKLGAKGADIGKTFDKVAKVAGDILVPVINVVSGVFKFFVNQTRVIIKIVEVLAKLFQMTAGVVKALLIVAFRAVVGVLSNVMDKLGPVGAAFKKVGTAIGSAFGNIGGIVKAAMSGVVGFIQTAINLAISAINLLIRAYNSIPLLSDMSEVSAFAFSTFDAAAGERDNNALGAEGPKGRDRPQAGKPAAALTPAGTGGGGGGGGEAEKENKKLDAIRAKYDKLKETLKAAASAYESIASQTESKFGEPSQIIKAFGVEGSISSVISQYDQLDSTLRDYYDNLAKSPGLSEKAIAKIKAAGTAQRNELTVLADRSVKLMKTRDKIQQDLKTLDETFATSQKDINANYDALDKAAEASLKAITAKWDQAIPALEKVLAATTAAFDKENAALQTLISERDSFLNNIKSGINSFVNAFSFDGANASGIQKQLEDRLKTVRDFAANIKTLIAKGLDPSLVREFVTAGVSGAGDAVAALASSSSGDIAGINAVQSGLAAEIAGFQTYASQQWFDAGIAQQEAIVGPLAAARDQAAAALATANASREAEIGAAQAHVDNLKVMRQGALDAALIDYNTQKAALIALGLENEAALKANAEAVQTEFTGLQATMPPQMMEIGQSAVRNLIAGFNERFPVMKEKFNNLMDNLARSMNRTAEIVVTTINRTVFEGKGLAGARAMGGSVMANSAYLVGEKGPEIFVPGMSGGIIPNSGMGSSSSMSAGSNTGNTYAITINTGIGDPRVIGEEVVNVISKFEKANGAVFARA